MPLGRWAKGILAREEPLTSASALAIRGIIMTFRSYIVLFLCIFSLSALPVEADQTIQARQLVQAAYNKQDIAYNHRDINGVIAFYAPNWTNGTSSYKVMSHKYDVRDFLVQLFGENGPFSVTQKITKFYLHGNQAVAIVEMRMISGPSTSHGYKSPALVMTGEDRDTWEHTQKGWLMTRCYMATGHIK